MTINDLTPQEKMILFMIRLSDALPPPRVRPDIGEDGSLQNSDIQKGGDNR